MATPIAELEARLAKVERSNRWLKALLLCLPVLILVSANKNAASLSELRADTVIAERFVLLDGENNEHGALEILGDGARLRVHSVDGKYGATCFAKDKSCVVRVSRKGATDTLVGDMISDDKPPVSGNLPAIDK